MSKTPTRIYVVTDTDDESNGKRLVRAASAAQAIRHCANHYTAHVASQDDIADLVGSDVEVEKAKAEAAQA